MITKEIFVKYFREILILVLGVILVFLLMKIYDKSNDNSELINYKLQVLDKEINELYEQRKNIDKSISQHNKNIQKIDSSINSLKIEKTTINKFFQIKENEIRQADARKVDSLLRLRYRY